mmetsp:Transcript_8138/g.18872  ORF Transcript_8138/g.18872 Transcript_8138/m.18872 type:complete len:520 (-) Transcript_8138:64-1623(-)
MAHETEDDMRAWGLSPTMSPRKDNRPSPTASPLFPDDAAVQPTSEPKARRSFTSPAPAANDGFADFANFDNAFPDSKTHTNAPKRSTSTPRNFLIEGTDQELVPRQNGNHHRPTSTASAAETPVSDLLVQAKANKTRRSQKPSSVNSAPTITAQYLRQYHGLRSPTASSPEARAAADKTTSVSDIIQSLEATNANRLRNSSRSRSHRSVSSRESGTNASVRSAKERIRERRRKEREGSASSRRHRSRSSEVGSDHSSDNDVSENWLFDEVTGALGPRGVAADMESLSGRSNRSKNSTGNKSHKSHRSHKSHKSSSRRRRKSSSNESVDSKNSRYSHRSTKSYLSQMSEQSRSVANDLLRLEMQLAMVGSRENGEDTHGRSGGSASGSIGGTAKSSRTSRASSAARRANSITKRSKMTVVAPPGKLGIILANKADSKGTVVSGVRTSSVLAEKISPGDRIVAIDGEDVSRMTVSEITTIMARKSEFERTLTVLTTPKPAARSPTREYALEPEGSYPSYRR